jgi:hypothetical protein
MENCIASSGGKLKVHNESLMLANEHCPQWGSVPIKSHEFVQYRVSEEVYKTTGLPN